MVSVSGRNRVPSPPTSTTAFIDAPSQRAMRPLPAPEGRAMQAARLRDANQPLDAGGSSGRGSPRATRRAGGGGGPPPPGTPTPGAPPPPGVAPPPRPPPPR